MPFRLTWLRLSLAILLPAALGGCMKADHAELASTPTERQSRLTKLTLAPLAFVRFCMRNEEQCRPTGQPDAVIPATPQAIAAIENVNSRINARIRPSDAEMEWRINPASGNCNDYVVSKRQELLAQGFPSSALLINVVQTPSGQGHLVLVVKTSGEDLVLDNLTASVRSVAETSYVWIKRQTSSNPRQWETA